jgi:pilus assembly protein CpaE
MSTPSDDAGVPGWADESVGGYDFDPRPPAPPEQAVPPPPRLSEEVAPSQPSAVPVAVVDVDQAVRNRLAMQLGEHAVAFGSIEELEARLPDMPSVAVLGPSFTVNPGVGDAEALIHTRPDVGVVLVAQELTTDLFQRALRLGVRDVLAAPADTLSLNEAVRRAAESVAGADDAPDAPPAHGAARDGIGRVITVFSTKGGAGKSVIASNLAVLLAKASDKPVVLIDADLQFGDLAVMLKMAPQHTIVDAIGGSDRLDPAFLQSLLVRHEPSGLLVLPAPLEPAFADQIHASDMIAIVEALRKMCAFVIVDTPAYFNEVVLSLIEDSDDVLLVAGMDIPNIKNVKIGLQTLRLLGTPMDKLHMVLNRANSKVRLDVNEVERTLQIKAICQLPSDVVVPQSVNKGLPVVLDSPRSGVAKAFIALSERFLPAAAETKSRKRR